jgi:hypothetical protein
VNINNIKEQPIAADVREELVQFEAASRAMLKLDASVADPDHIVRVISEHIDTLLGARPKKVGEEAITLLACLWGIQICRRLEWEWVELIVQGDLWYGIVSPNREYTIFPFVYMRDVLTNDGKENTALLVYNMLITDKFTPADAGSYQVLE